MVNCITKLSRHQQKQSTPQGGKKKQIVYALVQLISHSILREAQKKSKAEKIATTINDDKSILEI